MAHMQDTASILPRYIEEARAVGMDDVVDALGIGFVKGNRRRSPAHVYCPFHDGDSGCIYFSGDRNFFVCFGGCRSRLNPSRNTWNPIDLVMEVRNVSFAEAVAFLLNRSVESLRDPEASSTGLIKRQAAPVAPRRPAPPAREDKPIPLERIERYHARLMGTPEGEIALAYLQDRGISRRTALQWRLGLTDVWNRPLDRLEVDGLPRVLAALRTKALDDAAIHGIVQALLAGTLPDPQRQWLARYLNLDALQIVYSAKAHFQSHRLVIPVWEHGPPQEGNPVCCGLRFRYVKNLTPLPARCPGQVVRSRQDKKKYRIVEIHSDGSCTAQLCRDLAAPPVQLSAAQLEDEITKCWGQGGVKTLTANSREGKKFVIAVEGEMDLLSLYQVLLLTPLFRTCWLISSTNGASNFPQEWREHNFWRQFVRIYFAYDRDRAGQEAIARMREQGVTLDGLPVPVGKDMNEWHQACGTDIPAQDLLAWAGRDLWYTP